MSSSTRGCHNLVNETSQNKYDHVLHQHFITGDKCSTETSGALSVSTLMHISGVMWSVCFLRDRIASEYLSHRCAHTHTFVNTQKPSFNTGLLLQFFFVNFIDATLGKWLCYQQMCCNRLPHRGLKPRTLCSRQANCYTMEPQTPNIRKDEENLE